MILIIIVTAALFAVVIKGIFDYIKTEKPPAGLTYKEYYEYYRHRGIGHQSLNHTEDVDWEKRGRIIEYLKAGNKIMAIKEVREQAGCSLADATEAVEQLEISLARRGLQTKKL